MWFTFLRIHKRNSRNIFDAWLSFASFRGHKKMRCVWMCRCFGTDTHHYHVNVDRWTRQLVRRRRHWRRPRKKTRNLVLFLFRIAFCGHRTHDNHTACSTHANAPRLERERVLIVWLNEWRSKKQQHRREFSINFLFCRVILFDLTVAIMRDSFFCTTATQPYNQVSARASERNAQQQQQQRRSGSYET